MADIDNIRRIVAEDFKKEDRETVSRLGAILNHFVEQVVNAFDKRINFDNLTQELISYRVTVDSSGVPISNARIKSTYTNAEGMLVLSANNLTNTNVYPDSAPFISFTPSGTGFYTINKINGLQANQEYRLNILIVGN